MTASVPCDELALKARLEADGNLVEVGGHTGLGRILDVLPLGSAPLAAYYHQLLEECRVARQVAQTVRENQSDLESQIITPAEFLEKVGAASEGMSASSRKTLAEQLDALCDELQRREPPECFAFGLSTVDRHLGGGIQRGELAVVAAAALAATLMGGAAPLASVKEGIESVAVAFALDEAADTGHVIDLLPRWQKAGINPNRP